MISRRSFAYFSMIRRASMAGANPADYTTAPISGGQPVVGAAQPRRGAGPPGLGLMRGAGASILSPSFGQLVFGICFVFRAGCDRCDGTYHFLATVPRDIERR